MQIKLTNNIYILLFFLSFLISKTYCQDSVTNNNVQVDNVQSYETPNTPLKLKRAEFEKILKLSTEFLTHPLSRDVIKLGLNAINSSNEELNDIFKISSKVKNTLLETQCIELLAINRDFLKYVESFLQSGKNISDDGSEAAEKFKTDYAEKLKNIDFKNFFNEFSGYKPLPIVLTDTSSGYQNAKIFVSHDRYSKNGTVIKAQNLIQQVKDFIADAKSDITLNVFEFDLEEIANELIVAKSRGVKINVGIDANIIKEKSDVKKVYDLLTSKGIDVHPVSSVGLNHQKIIVRDAALPNKSKVLISSGNLTKSDLHPNGDLGDLPFSHKLSIPNANHLMIIDSDALALIAKNELSKTLVYKLKGD